MSRVSQRTGRPLESLTELTPERLLREVAKLANADRRRLYRPDGTLKQVSELDDETAAAVASVEHDEHGNVTAIELWPAEEARALLRRVRCLGNA